MNLQQEPIRVEVLQLEPSGLEEKVLRTQYRKMALKVHPDKQTEDLKVLL